MADALSPQVQEKLPRVPVEVCERVIGAVYEENYYLVQAALATLSTCALVCRAWRSPAQKVLFHCVIIRDKTALYQFAQLLDASPELGAYVRQVQLRGYLHVSDSCVVSFPAVLGARLTNLVHLYIFELGDAEKDANPLPRGVKEHPTLPLHRLYLPSLFTCISNIRTLHLYGIVFPSFGDFARTLHTLSNIRELSCEEVTWALLGQEPLCMASGRSQDSEQTFLPNLTWLRCWNMDEPGKQRLLGALGPSLRLLRLSLPNYPPSVRTESSAAKEKDLSTALNLRCFPRLEHLSFYLAPFPESYDSTLESLRQTLVSWVTSDEHGLHDRTTSQQHRTLYLEPFRYMLRREEFVEILRVIGPVVEAALFGGKTSSILGCDTGERICRATVVVQNLGDRLEWADWWATRVQECFPTVMRWERLRIDPCHNLHPTRKWIDHEQTPKDLSHILPPTL